MIQRPLQILLAEDNDDDVELLKLAFRTAGLSHDMAVVPDGKEALAYLRGEGQYAKAAAPDLMLCDINLPRKDGLTVLQEIKADSVLRNLPVIMLTTSHDEEDLVRAYRYGACSYVSKPVEFDGLLEVVKGFSLYWSVVSRLPQSEG